MRPPFLQTHRSSETQGLATPIPTSHNALVTISARVLRTETCFLPRAQTVLRAILLALLQREQFAYATMRCVTQPPFNPIVVRITPITLVLLTGHLRRCLPVWTRTALLSAWQGTRRERLIRVSILRLRFAIRPLSLPTALEHKRSPATAQDTLSPDRKSVV